MLGETPWNQRDFTFGLAGFLAGIHALRILAEKGIATAEDIEVSLEGIRATLRNLPEGLVSDTQRAGIDSMLATLHAAALNAAAPNTEEPSDG
jgi:hypothetical protein